MLTACKCHHRETSKKSRSSGGRSVQAKRPTRQVDSGLRLRRQNNRSECHPGAHPPVPTSQIGAQQVWAAAVECAGPMTKMQPANCERPDGSTRPGAVSGQPAFAMGELDCTHASITSCDSTHHVQGRPDWCLATSCANGTVSR
jgi:hypothetical protein